MKIGGQIFVSDEWWDKYRMYPRSSCVVAAKADD
jgi:hypothetical protein